ncbi:MAG: two-component system response regulator [Thiohalocapsa sp.]
MTTPSIVGKKSLVVIVDDQTAGRKILEHLVRSIDHDVDVVAFGDASSAEQFIGSATPDLIVTDYLMPEMDGVTFISRVRKMPHCVDVPIIVVTVVEDREIRYRALDAGATDFLNRPIDQHECRARCRNLLTLRRQRQIISSRANWLEEQVAVATRKIFAREQETLLRLARAGEYRDENTGNHVVRISRYCRLMAQSLGLSGPECDAIELAAPMHDIGKIGIPDHILLKPNKLTPAEFKVMRGHSRLGYEILCDSQSHYIQLGAIIALNHHEKYDGSGYPDGLRGDEIPQAARIVAVADVFDALTSVRPYKKAWSAEEARTYIRNLSGAHFDPDCVDAFMRIVPEIETVRLKLSDYVEPDAGHGHGA